MNNIRPDGGTNYVAAFEAAYLMFNNTAADEFGAPCQNIILFLTDG